MKRIVLCADDYGQNAAISQAIIDLIAKKRLSATSCMTNSPFWPKQAKALVPYKGQVDIGLHLNLTEGKALSSGFKKTYGPDLFSLSSLLLRAYTHRLNKAVLMEELNAQLDQFIEHLGQLPDFIDGHQHVHQFPIVRDVILTLYEQRLKNHSFIRCVYQAKLTGVKQGIIQLTGAKTLKNRLTSFKIPHNTSFSGIYDFADADKYSHIFPTFLEQVQEGGLIMCHPGVLTERDKIQKARQYEYEYFMSNQFLQACNSKSVIISQFSQI